MASAVTDWLRIVREGRLVGLLRFRAA